MPQKPPSRQAAPAEVITQMNLGLNQYTDPTLTKPTQWSDASNVYSGPFGYVARARWASLLPVANYVTSGLAFTTLKFFSLPGLDNYLLGDNNGKLWSFDSGSSYSATQRLNPYIDPSGAGSAQLDGPWSREVLQNIVYEMNGQVKASGRGANAAIIENWGLDAPDSSPQVTIQAGVSSNLSTIQRSNGIVTATFAAPFTVPGGNGVGMVNVVNVSDTSFNGTFVVATGSGTTTLTWLQTGQNTSSIAASGAVNTNITKSVGRSYAWAWENANKPHVGAPSPSTQLIAYNVQNGTILLTEPGIINLSSASAIVGGTQTQFTPAWVGRNLFVDQQGNLGRIISVQSPTQLTLAAPIGPSSGGVYSTGFQVFDPQATHVRLYFTADGGATYFRTQRNAFTPNAAVHLANVGLQFFDTAASEPPNFPFTTEISQLNNVPPPVGAFVKEYQGRLIVYGGTIPGQTFFYSNQESTTIGMAQESFAPLNQVTLPIQNGNINGMVDFPGSLVIWSDKQDMFRMTGLLSDNNAATGAQQGATISSLPYNLGCASPYAVALTPLGALWLTSNAEVWLYTDSYAPRQIGHPIQPILKSILPANLKLARMVYYHTYNRNWIALAVAANGASANNKLLLLDLDLLASNGSPSFFVFDMATNNPSWYPYDIACPALEQMYESGGIVRLFVGGQDTTTGIADVDYQSGGFGTEIPVVGSVTLHAWGNDHPFTIVRPSFARFNTNRDTSLLPTDGWVFEALGIDDDFYTFELPLVQTCTPGLNDTSILCGNPDLFLGEAFRHSPSLFRFGGVNFIAGRRLRFSCSFPTGTGQEYRWRGVQFSFGPAPPS